MAHAPISLGTHPLVDDRNPNYSALGDLSVGRTLGHALRRLNSCRKSPKGLQRYAWAWIEEMEDIDVKPLASCDRSGGWAIRIWVPLTGPSTNERLLRQRALSQHLDDTEGARAMIIDTLRRQARIEDDRDISTREIVEMIRPLIRTGGEVIVSPDGRPSIKMDIKLAFSRGSDPVAAEAHLAAARAAAPLDHQWRAHKRLARIATRLGTRLPNGWTVLAASASTERATA